MLIIPPSLDREDTREKGGKNGAGKDGKGRYIDEEKTVQE